MDTIRIGETKIRIQVEGCVKCGALHSSGWRVERTVTIRIDNRRPITADISICADCDRKGTGRQKRRTTKDGGEGHNLFSDAQP